MGKHCEHEVGTWDGDNRHLVLDVLVPTFRLTQDDKQVIRWVYEFVPEEEGKTFEQTSDGETMVKDNFLDGVIKSVAGVTHDGINRIPNHVTPDGHVWTVWESNALYRRIKKAEGAGFRLRWRRWAGLTISAALAPYLGGVFPKLDWWK